MRALCDVLRMRVERTPHALAYRFIGPDHVVELTYAELHRKARAIACALRERAATGDRALLMYAPGLEMITAFWGCLLAAVVAVPLAPPVGRHVDRQLPALLAIARHADPSLLLTTASLEPMVRAAIPADIPVAVVATDTLEAEGKLPDVSSDTVALLQYTSGSTGAAKGVVVTHANLMTNLRSIARCNARGSGEGVSWLPQYHDMGLIGGTLLPAFEGFAVSLLSPLDILKQPVRWLEAITRYRAAVSPAPPFALDLCVRRVPLDAVERLDLTTWRVAFVGAEPIAADVLERFAAKFAPAGFRPDAFVPCYGLAEATLLVSGSPRAAPPTVRRFAADALEAGHVVPSEQGGRALVGCGPPAPEVELIIDAPPGRVGEICVRGASISRGYWGDGARGDAYLRTGDLGFVLGGELFVCGRSKDLVIIRGRNHHAHDLEATATRSHPAVRAGCVAAFGDDEADREVLVVVAELAVNAPTVEVAAAIRAAIARHHDVRATHVVLVDRGAIPKTTSGKLQRGATRTMYRRGELSGAHEP